MEKFVCVDNSQARRAAFKNRPVSTTPVNILRRKFKFRQCSSLANDEPKTGAGGKYQSNMKLPLSVTTGPAFPSNFI
uniref:Uncharacterized protein n=1 Tax=Romanomermis culicivorax TaxID=13658 RepID=A0A915JP17_ROMCU